LPDVPTSVELGYPGMIMENWYGMLGPAGMPAETRASLEKAALEAVHSPQIARQLAAGGASGATGGKEFAEKLAKDVSHWGPELKKLGIQGE
jgi:tripartite-type tricarboxylate transporter receptor subunit TctC